LAQGFSPAQLTTVSVAAFAYLTLAGTVVAFGAYVWLLDHAPISLVTTYTFVNPVIAVILGWALLGEHLEPQMLAGMLLVIGSVIALWLTNRSPRNRERSERVHNVDVARRQRRSGCEVTDQSRLGRTRPVGVEVQIAGRRVVHEPRGCR
jgi:multidrug transporter EmrE-like cation transporter